MDCRRSRCRWGGCIQSCIGRSCDCCWSGSGWRRGRVPRGRFWRRRCRRCGGCWHGSGCTDDKGWHLHGNRCRSRRWYRCGGLSRSRCTDWGRDGRWSRGRGQDRRDGECWRCNRGSSLSAGGNIGQERAHSLQVEADIDGAYKGYARRSGNRSEEHRECHAHNGDTFV